LLELEEKLLSVDNAQATVSEKLSDVARSEESL
jgi:hypothetical protein